MLKLVPFQNWSSRHFWNHFNPVSGCSGSFINQWCVISKYLELVPKFYTVAPLKRVCKALPQQLLLSQDLLRLTSAHWNMQNWANIYCYSVKWAGTKWNKSIFTGTIWNELCLEESGTELERNEFQWKIRWNGTERVPVQGWVERNGTSSKKIGTEYNTGFDYIKFRQTAEKTYICSVYQNLPNTAF